MGGVKCYSLEPRSSVPNSNPHSSFVSNLTSSLTLTTQKILLVLLGKKPAIAGYGGLQSQWFGRLRREDCKFKASLSNLVRP